MPHNRFFIDTPLPKEGGSVTICDPQEVHHLQHVMKCREGDAIELIDGQGGLAFATIVELRKQKKSHHCVVHVDRYQRFSRPEVAVTMALSTMQPSHLDIALEKCTELGASDFLFFPADYSEYQELPSLQKQERYQRIVRGALKQSGALFEPSLSFFSSLHDAFSSLTQDAFVLDLSEKARPTQTIFSHTMPLHNKLALFVGPESGWSNEERAFFEHMIPDHIVRLTDTTLRAETAAVIGCYEMLRSFNK